tara:strand:- start:76 stop:813 length:738 start_codon:yes stop_codon:yes gene_type:complete
LSLKTVKYDNLILRISNNYINSFEDAATYFKHLHYKINNRFYIIPGGKTPKLFYEILANDISDWDSTTMLLSDERVVDLDSDLSNEYLVRETLIKKINQYNDIKLLSIDRQIIKQKSMVNSFNQLVKKNFDEKAPVLSILGIGNDGHTASLFPDNKLIYDNNDHIISYKKPGEDFYRLSITFHALMKTRELMFLVVGDEKAKILKEILENDDEKVFYPVNYLIENYKNKITIFCDSQASKLLEKN